MAIATVIITTKNSAPTIRGCIESVMDSNYKDFKIMVVDSFSKDGTWNTLKRMKKKYKNKLQIEQLESNIAKAHNHMIGKCNSKYIAFTDSDCAVDKDWLHNLLSGFKEKGVIATGGYCGTPIGVNKLQRLIGRELEDRFRNFPKYMTRFPTMNLAVRTSIARKNLFDESFDVAQESDWGFRISKLGKMVYVPPAVVWHYHRATWSSYFKQQFKYGKSAVKLYMKHRGKMKGDPITKGTMTMQPMLLLLTILSLPFFPIASALPAALLSLIILHDSLKLSRSVADFFYYLAIFAVRLIGWTLGMLSGFV